MPKVVIVPSSMASPLRALSATLLLLAIALVNCEAKLSAIHAIGRQLSEHTQPVIPNKPKFRAGPWTKARATFYDGSTSSFGNIFIYLLSPYSSLRRLLKLNYWVENCRGSM